MTAFLSLAGMIFFWLINRSAEEALKSKNLEKSEIISQIGNSYLADVESKATMFKSAVAELTKVNKSRYLLSSFIIKFDNQIAQNVQLTNLGIGADGKIDIGGTTNSYRSVANQIMLFKDWKVNGVNILRDVQLMSISQALNEDKNINEVTFLVSANLDKTKTLDEILPEENKSAQPGGQEDITSGVDEISGTGDVNDGGSSATIQ
jgi:hypothetical protein